jgi:hypothetical protein
MSIAHTFPYTALIRKPSGFLFRASNFGWEGFYLLENFPNLEKICRLPE